MKTTAVPDNVIWIVIKVLENAAWTNRARLDAADALREAIKVNDQSWQHVADGIATTIVDAVVAGEISDLKAEIITLKESLRKARLLAKWRRWRAAI